MKESAYLTHLRGRFLERHPDGFWYKIPDSMGVDGQKRPYDVYAFYDGNFLAIEGKMHKTIKPFYFSSIRPHQIYNLRKVHRNKGDAYVSLGVRCEISKSDRARLAYKYSKVSLDIWIPVQLIPGRIDEMNVTALEVERLLIPGIKGNRINEIYLPKERFEEVTR
jgi:hypothetical protein